MSIIRGIGKDGAIGLRIAFRPMGQFGTSISSTGSGRVQSERSNIVKNSIVMGASTVASGVTFMALKMLTRGTRD